MSPKRCTTAHSNCADASAAAIIVTGGSGGPPPYTSVELLHGDGSPWCSLPDLPEGRWHHTQTGLEACGGDHSYPDSYTSCVKFTDGTWTPSHTLLQYRYNHVSWASPSGTVLMGGPGYDDLPRETTELLDEATEESVMHFPLKYETW